MPCSLPARRSCSLAVTSSSPGVIPPAALRPSLCGPGRPGHFEGVATVVCRLLALVRPDRLLLGEKDWQQLIILRRVVADLALPVTVQGCGTVREADGLACSSRHRYLSAQERRQAAALPAALASAAQPLAWRQQPCARRSSPRSAGSWRRRAWPWSTRSSCSPLP